MFKKGRRGGLGGDGYITGVIQVYDGRHSADRPFDLTHQRQMVSPSRRSISATTRLCSRRKSLEIEQVAAYLNENTRTVLIVEGHCDERSSNSTTSLGEQRAYSVHAYLVNLGISPDRVQSRSWRSVRPWGTGEAVWRLVPRRVRPLQ